MRIAMFRGYGDLLTDASMTILDQAVPKVVIDSTLLPQVSIEHPFAPGGPPSAQATGDGAGNQSFLQILKPRATVYTVDGGHTIAPWGDPGDVSYWPLVQAGVMVTGVLAAYGLFKLLRGGK